MSQGPEEPVREPERLSVNEQAFLAAIAQHLDPVLKRVDQSIAIVDAVRKRSLVAAVASGLSFLMFLGLLYVVIRQNTDRAAARLSVCVVLNDTIERARLQSEAIITSSNSAPPSTPRTPEQEQLREAQIKFYVEAQGFRYVDGRVIAPKIDCRDFSTNGASKPKFEDGKS